MWINDIISFYFGKVVLDGISSAALWLAQFWARRWIFTLAESI